ncbi:hypothetical protein CBER1_10168 [Cercospora berteroae]|uniref:Uncharacterized protein n=1 Tax=Cercospora berteroae TaxID=357750 RepID=A0A2S6BYL0_9PEZI|nr:hypothetical protein CBER1_10168 [Cercospora berteroae]
MKTVYHLQSDEDVVTVSATFTECGSPATFAWCTLRMVLSATAGRWPWKWFTEQERTWRDGRLSPELRQSYDYVRDEFNKKNIKNGKTHQTKQTKQKNREHETLELSPTRTQSAPSPSKSPLDINSEAMQASVVKPRRRNKVVEPACVSEIYDIPVDVEDRC